MDPAVWGPLIGGATTTIGAWLMFKAQRATSKGTEKVETVKVQMDGWERLHNADVSEQERLKAALIEERAVSQAIAAKAERLEVERDQARAEVARLLAEGSADAQA